MFDIAIATLKDEIVNCENVIDAYEGVGEHADQFIKFYKEDIETLKAAIEVLKNYEE